MSILISSQCLEFKRQVKFMYRFATTLLFCPFPTLLMQLYFLLDDTQYTKLHQYVHEVFEQLLLFVDSICKLGYLQTQIQSTFLQLRKSWQRCNTFRFYAQNMFSDIFLLSSPIVLMCYQELLRECTFHLVRI